MDDQNKNLILATVLSFLVIMIWFFLFPPEEPVPPAPIETTDLTAPPPQSDLAMAPPAAQAPAELPATATTEAARVEAPRFAIDTPNLDGSISLAGGRIDRVALKTYRETIDPESPEVQLLAPVGGPNAYYALFGWTPGAGGALDFTQVPRDTTPWEIAQGDTLRPDSPVTLEWDNGAGLIFRRTLSVDDEFMFTVTQSVQNTSAETQRLAPYGLVARHGQPDTINFFILHEGVVRMSDGELQEISYNNMTDLEEVPRERARAEIISVNANGWVGFTDKYWMTTLVPAPGSAFTSVAKYDPSRDIYQTEARLPTMTVAPGERAEVTTQLFVGAKEWEAIRGYQRAGVEGFIDSIDWGWFFFLTKPIFWLLHELNLLIGNMGWAIIVLTLVIKAVLFPLAYTSYVSMAKMKELQPEMEKLKERVGDDRQKMQVEMMELYKKEKVNPAAGCLPILLQIPIFFSLYKVIFVTIEIRHAPWFGWIQDLSAPDPSSILNLFGILPYAVPNLGALEIISLGILPIALGISMWLQQKLNPAPTDPTQQMIFAWLPWVFMFMLGTFASGLILYWIANNVITFAQQYLIMARHGKPPELFDNIRSGFKRARGSSDSDKKDGA